MEYCQEKSPKADPNLPPSHHENTSELAWCFVSVGEVLVNYPNKFMQFWIIVAIIPSRNLKKQRNILTHGPSWRGRLSRPVLLMVEEIWGWRCSKSRVQKAMRLGSRHLVKPPVTSDSLLLVRSTLLRDPQPQKTASVARSNHLQHEISEPRGNRPVKYLVTLNTQYKKACYMTYSD